MKSFGYTWRTWRAEPDYVRAMLMAYHVAESHRDAYVKDRQRVKAERDRKAEEGFNGRHDPPGQLLKQFGLA